MIDFDSKKVGKFGEDYCAKHIKKEKGLKILARNATIGKLEVDIIAYNNDYIVFIEVKTRRTDKKNFWRPSSAVDKDKQANLINFAGIYCSSLPKKYQGKTPRIDVCEILISVNKKPIVEDILYIENAVSK